MLMSSTTAPAVASVAINELVEFSDVYDLVVNIDSILKDYTILDSTYPEIQPIQSIEYLPFFPNSAFKKTSKAKQVDFIYQFEMSIYPGFYPDPYSQGGYDYLFGLIKGDIRPVDTHHYIVANSGDNADILTVDSKAIASITSNIVLDTPADATLSCWDTSYTVSADTWAQNMMFCTKNTFKRRWIGYEQDNPLPTADQCNAYFVCTKSPCHGGCCIFRLCDQDLTGQSSVGEQPYPEGSTGAALGMRDPAELRPPVNKEPGSANMVMKVPTCSASKIIWPKTIYQTGYDFLEENKEVNIYNPNILYVHQWLPETDPIVQAWIGDEKVWDSIANVASTDYESKLNVPVGNSAYYHAKWIPARMCGGGPSDVAVRLNLFKINIPPDDKQPGGYYCFTIPTAIRMRMRGYWKPAIRKYWYDVILHTLRYCTGYSASTPYKKLGTTWNKKFREILQESFNPVHAAIQPTKYTTVNYGDLWFEQYVGGKNEMLNGTEELTSNPIMSGSYPTTFDRYVGGLCSRCVSINADEDCPIVVDCGKEFELPWHGGCKNTKCSSGGYSDDGTSMNANLPNTHAFTFNVLKQIAQDIKDNKIKEQLDMPLVVLENGIAGAGLTVVQNESYNPNNLKSKELEQTLVVYSTTAESSEMVYDYLNVSTDDIPYLYRAYSASVTKSEFNTQFPGLTWVDGYSDPQGKQIVTVTVRATGELEYDVVLDENVYSDSRQEITLIAEDDRFSAVLTTNTYSHLWLIPEFKYASIGPVIEPDIPCKNPESAFFDAVFTDNTCNISITPSKVLTSSQENYSAENTDDPSEDTYSASNLNVIGYDVVLGVSCLLDPKKDVNINIGNLGALMPESSWGIGMIGRLYSIATDTLSAELYAQLDWYSLDNSTGKYSINRTELEPIAQDYYAHYVQDPSRYAVSVNKLYSAYAMLRCRDLSVPLNEGEVWCPAMEVSGGTIIAKASLLHNDTTSNAPVVVLTSKQEANNLTLSIPADEESYSREFYGLIRVHLRFKPTGSSDEATAALLTYATADAKKLQNELITPSEWTITGFSATYYSPQEPVMMVYSTFYEAKEINTSCYNVYTNLYPAAATNITVKITQ